MITGNMWPWSEKRERGSGNRKMATKNRELRTGNWEQETRMWEMGTLRRRVRELEIRDCIIIFYHLLYFMHRLPSQNGVSSHWSISQVHLPHIHFPVHVFSSIPVLMPLPSAFHFSFFVSCFSYFASCGSWPFSFYRQGKSGSLADDDVEWRQVVDRCGRTKFKQGTRI